MEDRTVILTLVNEAWAQPGSLLDIYRESFKNGEDIEHFLNHVLVIAIDAGGFGRCKAVHPHCYLLEVNKSTANLSSANRFMNHDKGIPGAGVAQALFPAAHPRARL